MDERTLHDLKNPLTVITCQTQMIQRRVQRGSNPDKDQILKSLDAIEQMVARVNTAIDALASDTQEDALPSASSCRAQNRRRCWSRRRLSVRVVPSEGGLLYSRAASGTGHPPKYVFETEAHDVALDTSGAVVVSVALEELPDWVGYCWRRDSGWHGPIGLYIAPGFVAKLRAGQ